MHLCNWFGPITAVCCQDRPVTLGCNLILHTKRNRNQKFEFAW